MQSFFPEALSKENLNQYLLLFVTGSDSCGQCLNEIIDYISLANETAPISGNYSALLLYHGVDRAKSDRFIRSTNISNQVDELAYVPLSSLPSFDHGVLTNQYSPNAVLYLFDQKDNLLLHVFILPTGNTTKWEAKQIAFSNAIQTINQQPIKRR